MREVYGNIIVVLDNPVQTDSFYGVPIYNGIFVKVKDNVFTTFHMLLSDGRLRKHILEEGGYRDYSRPMRIAEALHESYYANKYYNTVRKVKVVSTGLSPGVTAFYLKVLNILDKSDMPEKYKRFFDGEIIDAENTDDFPTVLTISNAKIVLNKIVQSYIYSFFEEAKFRSGRVIANKSIFPTQLIQLLEFGLSKPSMNPIIINSDIKVESDYPVYTKYSYGNSYGDFHACGVNDKLVMFYKPALSSKLIIVHGELVSGSVGKIIDFKTYYDYYRPKRSRGLRVVHVSTDVPVITHCPLDDNVYFLAQVRDGVTEPIIVKVPRSMIVIDIDKTRIKCCGKEYPVAGVKGSTAVAYLFSHKLLKNNE